MPRNLSDSFFGSIALKNRMLSRDQLTQALRVQWERTRDGAGPTLGEVCRMLGFLKDDEVNAILWAQAKSEVLLEDSLTGSLCVANRLVTKAQLDEALEDQRALDYTVRLGDLLCEKGLIDRQQLHAVLKAQSRLKTKARPKPVIVPPARPSAAPPPSVSRALGAATTERTLPGTAVLDAVERARAVRAGGAKRRPAKAPPAPAKPAAKAAAKAGRPPKAAKAAKAPKKAPARKPAPKGKARRGRR
jgi:hypothetical protein